VSSTTGVSVGDLLYQSPIAQATVTEVVSGTVLTVDATVTWAAASATVYTGIQYELLWSAQFAGNAENWKHWREATLHFGTPAFSLGSAIFQCDTNPAELDVDLALGGFGVQPWSEFSWAQPGGPKNKRAGVPTNCQRSSYLNVGFSLREARSVWKLNGYTLTFEAGSERGTH
jgi:hypothetical protein